MTRGRERTTWVSYLRVSTTEQAERELSLPAQRAAISEYAARRGVPITREYAELGASGTDPRRREFRRMLEDVYAPGSDIKTIVVHHTSRFTRDATEARVVKSKLGKIGVNVVSVCQDLHNDPMGRLMEGFFECIDEYESAINGVRTASAMREAVRQGFFPGAIPPYGYRSEKITIGTGVVRHRLVPDEVEAEVVREIYRLYIADNGAKTVARRLNQCGLRVRSGRLWSRAAILRVLDDTTATGIYYWGRRATRSKHVRPRAEWMCLRVEPIVEESVHALATTLRERRCPRRNPGRAPAPVHVLSGFLRCGQCGASYQLETSGKRIDGELYRYTYYNCRSACRVGKELCAGFRVPTGVLDAAVFHHLADLVCTDERAADLRARVRAAHTVSVERVAEIWRSMLLHDPLVKRTYARHLIDRIDVSPTVMLVEARRV